MSVSKLRFFDILIFSAVVIVIDTIVGLTGFFGIRLFFSIGIPITFLIYIRWGKYAIILNLALVILHFIVHFESFSVNLAHSIGILVLLNLLWLRKWSNIQTRHIEFHNVFLLFTGLYFVMITVELALLYLFGEGVQIGGFYINQGYNYLIGLGLLFIISKQKDLIVDMDIYLLDNLEGA